MKAIIYTRVSTDEQADRGYSLPNQKERLETYCRINKIEVVKHFEDDHSAKSFERPEFKKLVEFAHQNKGKIDLLLIIKWDRFSRNVTDSWMMIRTLRNLGIKVDAIEQRIDTDIPEQKLMLSFYLTAPEVENDRRALNTIAGMRKAMKEGRWVAGAPLGYTMGRDYLQKPLLKKNEKAPLIKEAFELYSTGMYTKEEVRRKILAKGLKCGKNNFWRIFNNPVYAGRIRIKAWRNESEEIVKAQHEGIVSEELFYKVQQVTGLKRPNKSKQSKWSAKFPLRGILMCKRCGGNLTASSSKGKCGGIYHYYHCQHGCKERISAAAIHDSFNDWLNVINLRPAIAAVYKGMIEEKYKTQVIDRQKEINRLEGEKHKCEEMLIKAVRNLNEDKIDRYEFNLLKKDYEQEIIKYTSQIAELGDVDKNFIEYANYAFTLLSNLPNGYQDTSLEGKQKLISLIFPNKLTFDGKKYRTPVQSRVLQVLFNNSKTSEPSEMELVGKNADQFAQVTPVRLELTTQRLRVFCSTN